MHDMIDMTSSYVIGFMLLLSQNSDTILAFGGMVLLVIRFIADAPRAWKNIRGWFGYDN